jgi:hypothetical protein
LPLDSPQKPDKRIEKLREDHFIGCHAPRFDLFHAYNSSVRSGFFNRRKTPMVKWLAKKAWDASGAQELVQTAQCLKDSGAQLLVETTQCAMDCVACAATFVFRTSMWVWTDLLAPLLANSWKMLQWLPGPAVPGDRLEGKYQP